MEELVTKAAGLGLLLGAFTLAGCSEEPPPADAAVDPAKAAVVEAHPKRKVRSVVRPTDHPTARMELEELREYRRKQQESGTGGAP